MKILSALILSALLTGCVVAGPGYYVATPTAEVVVYEPDVVVGQYYVGYYNPSFGYWTGTGWDVNFYVYGHGGYGHYYRGAPRGYYHNYVSGPHYRGGVNAHRWHH